MSDDRDAVAVEPAEAAEPAGPPEASGAAEPGGGEASGVAAEPVPAGTTPRAVRGIPLLLVAVVAVAAVAAALAAVVATRVASHNADSHARSAALAAATGGVATVLSYDYRHLDGDFARAEALLTPRFRKQYDATTAKGVKPLAAKYHAVSSADVSAAGVVHASADRAVVLVMVSQTVTNNRLAQPRLDRSRINVTLVKQGGHWLIDRLEPI